MQQEARDLALASDEENEIATRGHPHLQPQPRIIQIR